LTGQPQFGHHADVAALPRPEQGLLVRKAEELMDMSGTASTDIVMAAFAAVEARDERRLAELYHPEVEFHWPPSLPYGGSFRGAVDLRAADRTGFDQVWDPLQPTRQERRMDPRVIAATDKEVVVFWHQRGLSPTGKRLDMEVLGLYGVRDGKFARAQMFYFDTTTVVSFLQQPQ
jgi:uncharacterized protein